MNSFVVITFVACLAAANASWPHGSTANLVQGPSSKTTLVGPEGSVISTVASGGQIVQEEHPKIVTHTAPVVARPAPIVYSAPVIAHAAPVVTRYAPATVVARPSPYERDSTLVAGPSGLIATGYAAHVAPVVTRVASVVTHEVPEVYSHEGQYVHEYSESLDDDGSYKPYLYHY